MPVGENYRLLVRQTVHPTSLLEHCWQLSEPTVSSLALHGIRSNKTEAKIAALTLSTPWNCTEDQMHRQHFGCSQLRQPATACCIGLVYERALLSSAGPVLRPINRLFSVRTDLPAATPCRVMSAAQSAAATRALTVAQLLCELSTKL